MGVAAPANMACGTFDFQRYEGQWKGNGGKHLWVKTGYMGGTRIYGGPSWRYKCGMPSRAGVPQGLLTLLFIPTPPKPSLPT